jgi:hypothetical protein
LIRAFFARSSITPEPAISYLPMTGSETVRFVP